MADRKRRAVTVLRERFGVSERRACTAAGIYRSTMRLAPGLEVSGRDPLEHVNVKGLVGDQLLQPGVFGLELFEPFHVVGFHAAVLGDPAVPRRLGDLQVPAHPIGSLPEPRSLFPLASLRMI